MSAQPLDVAIVGAGHNGLVAAAYLARAGLSVEVFERRDIAGGACVTEELWPGVRASPAAYTLSLLRAEIIEELDLRRHGLEVHVHEPYLFAPYPDGRHVVTWSDPARTHQQLARDWSREDADAYLSWAQLREQAAARARPLMLEPAERQQWLEAAGPEILDGAIADELAGIPSEPVRVPFALQGLIGTLAGPRDPGTSFVSFYHDLGEAAGPAGAWGFARGGMGSVTAALRSAAEAAGVRVHLESPVERVLVEDARCTGLVLADGSARRASATVSAADPLTTAELAGLEAPAGWRQAGPVVKVMVLLDGLPEFPSWPGEEAWHGSIDIGYSLEDLDRAAQDARAGHSAEAPWIEAACQTAVDDSLAPPGRHVVSLFCQCFPPDVDPEAAADAAIARFALACPEFPDRIVERLALGPRELEARFGIAGGHIFHGEMLPGQLFEDRIDRREFGGVESLYLAGSGAHPGGAVTGAPGYLAAKAVLEDLSR
ncbi:MAG TPA: NAD(P)/FAD-dependent oxidoreductase [Thermoleophilaceae bacterium]|nr:NAD(P)/FAD-dependent oxidoreductase [Thermoleophilaceae bacterium]